MLTQSEIRRLTNYNEETGEFTWSANAHKKVRGKPVGSMSRNGYLVTKVDYKRYLVHRLVWLYVHGEFPKDEIDHINRNKADNRVSNLRDVDRFTNVHNKSKTSNSVSGYTGVRRTSNKKRWQAFIHMGGKFMNLGVYDTIDEALSARVEYKRRVFGDM